MSGDGHLLRRYSKEAVGAFVLAAIVTLLLGASQAGRIQEWLNPGITIKVLMPEEGLYGLSAGADVEILGTVAGEVREIVIDPGQTMHALVNLRREVTPFLREDSRAFIKRRFGVAGDAYLEITRGTKERLDLEYAVLQASAERIPTQTVEQLISEVRGRLLPILDQAQDAIGAFAQVSHTVSEAEGDVRDFLASLKGISQRIERGEGSIGRLIADDTLIRELEIVLTRTQQAVAGLTPILQEMQAVASNASTMSEQFARQSSAIPKVTERAVATLDSLQAVMEDVKKTTPELPRLTRNVAESTKELPILLMQSQQTMLELEQLLRQLRASWLLGGGDKSETPSSPRLSPLEVTP